MENGRKGWKENQSEQTKMNGIMDAVQRRVKNEIKQIQKAKKFACVRIKSEVNETKRKSGKSTYLHRPFACYS